MEGRIRKTGPGRQSAEALIGCAKLHGPGDQLPNDVKVDAMRRHGDAMDAAGIAWPIIEAVCIKDLRANEPAARLHIHPRHATGQLEVGLDVLANHYGLQQRIARGTLKG